MRGVQPLIATTRTSSSSRGEAKRSVNREATKSTDRASIAHRGHRGRRVHADLAERHNSDIFFVFDRVGRAWVGGHALPAAGRPHRQHFGGRDED